MPPVTILMRAVLSLVRILPFTSNRLTLIVGRTVSTGNEEGSGVSILRESPPSLRCSPRLNGWESTDFSDVPPMVGGVQLAVSLRLLPILGAPIWRAFPGVPLGLGANVATPVFG